MKNIIIAILLSVITLKGFLQSNNKTENIRKLLELTGAGKLGIQMMNQFFSSFKTTYSSVPEEFWSEFKKEVNADALIDLIIPIYDKYFTEEDLNQLIQFYNSPIGKKVIESQPLILQESMLAGQAWGSELSKKVVGNLKAKGYL